MAVDERAELRGKWLDGRYEVGPCLGVGGTGIVFDAMDHYRREPVVIKVLRPAYAHNAEMVARLRREAEVPRDVPHSGIVDVRDEGVLLDGSPYLVMDRVYGESLLAVIRRGTLAETEVCALAIRVAAILHACHKRGYVHRDVKPEHVVLGRSEDGGLKVTLLDFGVCASSGAPKDERDRERGRVYGTPTYVSPEQAGGEPYVDARADVYGLGVVMYEALTGRVPFTGPSVSALLRRILREDAPRLGLVADHVSRECDEVVSTAMARELELRFPTARALARALLPLAGDRVYAESSLIEKLAVAPLVRDGSDEAPTLRVAAA